MGHDKLEEFLILAKNLVEAFKKSSPTPNIRGTFFTWPFKEEPPKKKSGRPAKVIERCFAWEIAEVYKLSGKKITKHKEGKFADVLRICLRQIGNETDDPLKLLHDFNFSKITPTQKHKKQKN